MPGHRLGELGDRVVVVDHRAVPGAARGASAAARPCPSPRSRSGRAAGVAEREREPADLADRLGDALEQVRVVVDQPVRALAAAGLLVGEEARARRRAAAGGPRAAAARTTASIIASMSFMSTAPRPQTQPSAISPEKGSYGQSAASAGTTSRWPWISSARAAGSVALDPRDHAGPARRRTRRISAPGRPRRASRRRTRRPAAPPGPLSSPVVGRVDPDQVAAEVDDLVLGRSRPGSLHGHLRRAHARPPAAGVSCLAGARAS